MQKKIKKKGAIKKPNYAPYPKQSESTQTKKKTTHKQKILVSLHHSTIKKQMINQETIVALATPSGAGAIAIIRLSGNEAISIASSVFESVSGKDIAKQKT
ncbi:MAG: 3-deoxy-D-arabino-heptulosonate 7-phosphate (DAHP) synthase, partial [Flavobacterium sp.]